MRLLDYQSFLNESKLHEAVDKTSFTMYVDEAIKLVKNPNLIALFNWVKNNTPIESFAIDAILAPVGEFKRKQLSIKASYDSNIANLINAIKDFDFAKVIKSTGGSGRGGFTTIQITYPESNDADVIKLINSSKKLGSTAPSTLVQETVSLIVFKQFIENDISTIYDIISILEEVWPEIESSKDWMNSFQEQGATLKNYMNGNKGYEYFLREGFPKKLYEIAKAAGFSNSDSWDPADVWLVKNTGKHNDAITKIWESNQTIGPINDYLRKQLNTREIIPISLKKTGKTASLQEVNLEKTIESGTLDIRSIYCDLDIKKDSKDRYSYNNAGARMDFNDGSTFSARSFTANSFSIEGIPAKGGSGGRLGKVPKNIVETKLKDSRLVFSEWKKTFNQHGDLANMYDVVVSSALVDSRTSSGKTDIWMKAMEEAFDNPDTRDGVYTQKCLALLVTYHIVKMTDADRSSLANTFFYSCQKSGEDFGPHIKIY